MKWHSRYHTFRHSLNSFQNDLFVLLCISSSQVTNESDFPVVQLPGGGTARRVRYYDSVQLKQKVPTVTSETTHQVNGNRRICGISIHVSDYGSIVIKEAIQTME